MRKCGGFRMPGTRNEGARDPWFLLDINSVPSLILASLPICFTLPSQQTGYCWSFYMTGRLWLPAVPKFMLQLEVNPCKVCLSLFISVSVSLLLLLPHFRIAGKGHWVASLGGTWTSGRGQRGGVDTATLAARIYPCWWGSHCPKKRACYSPTLARLRAGAKWSRICLSIDIYKLVGK